MGIPHQAWTLVLATGATLWVALAYAVLHYSGTFRRNRNQDPKRTAKEKAWKAPRLDKKQCAGCGADARGSKGVPWHDGINKEQRLCHECYRAR